MSCDAVRYDAGVFLGGSGPDPGERMGERGAKKTAPLNDVMLLAKMQRGDGEAADAKNR